LFARDGGSSKTLDHQQKLGTLITLQSTSKKGRKNILISQKYLLI